LKRVCISSIPNGSTALGVFHPVADGADANLFFESGAEVFGRRKAGALGDFPDLKVGAGQQFSGVAEALAEDLFVRSATTRFARTACSSPPTIFRGVPQIG
jgi:hypothetical protein